MSNVRIAFILQNEIYRGDLLLQKNFNPDSLKRRHQKNRGELPKYYVSENHEPIITPELWQAVQDKIKESRDFNPAANRIIKPHIFTKKIICGICGNHYYRSTSNTSKTERPEIWVCYGKIKNGKDSCHSRGLRGDRLREVITQVLGLEEFDEKEFMERIDKIITTDKYTAEGMELEFRFYDGTVRRAPIYIPPHN